jgi:hypothetical protein
VGVILSEAVLQAERRISLQIDLWEIVGSLENDPAFGMGHASLSFKLHHQTLVAI